jgi:hypothetical protein
VPRSWTALPADDTSYYLGVAASPHPTLDPGGPLTRGLIATRIDATQVGVPSDFYYLAAHGPILSSITSGESCRVAREWVYADHMPASMNGVRRSPGDFIARATGICGRGSHAIRWSYFVAAPGFGPARLTGIPGSGLYLIVATAPDSPDADRTLALLIRRVRFGDASPRDFVAAIREAE